MNASIFAKSMSKSKYYLKGLNGLRFFAACAVIITHLELLKGQLGIPCIWSNPLIQELGPLGVNFFFVLSGFLITYLLFVEKEKNNFISIKSFYLRRILRIWPLYYFIVFLGFFILPNINILDVKELDQAFHQHFTFQLFSYSIILPNLGYAMYGPVPHIGQLWSIGVEEQFYLIWPILMKGAKKYLKLFIPLLLGIILFKVCLVLVPSTHPNILALKKFFAMSKIECMVIGAIGAYVFKYKPNLLKLIYPKAIQILCYVSIPLLILYTPQIIQDGIHLVFSSIFLIIILNVSSNSASVLKLENKSLKSLGDVSYGMYMYHMMVIPIVITTLNSILYYNEHKIVYNFLLYMLTFASTIGISFLSYRSLEKYFLKLKIRFSKI